MPDDKFPVEVVGGVPVVAAPAEVDITNAEELQSALIKAAANGHRTLVVDMTGTQFCDSSGLHALIAVHKKAEPGSSPMRRAPTQVRGKTHLIRPEKRRVGASGIAGLLTRRKTATPATASPSTCMPPVAVLGNFLIWAGCGSAMMR